MRVLIPLAVSLALTLVLESAVALLWRVKRKDLLLVALANILTNPIVVLCYLAARYYNAALLPFVAAIAELGAFAAEGYLFAARSAIRRPWLFSLCANLASFILGLII